VQSREQAKPVIWGQGGDFVFLDRVGDSVVAVFGRDHRLVGAYKFYRQDGEVRFRAEARDPRPSH
jgi:hypothetical protein